MALDVLKSKEVQAAASALEDELLMSPQLDRRIQQKIQDVATLSRKVRSDNDPDIPLLLRTINQLQGVFNANRDATIMHTGYLSAPQRNAERARMLRVLNSGNVSRAQFDEIVRRTDELHEMMMSDRRK